MLKINANSDLFKVAQTITSNSELFGDEVETVEGELRDALLQAETIGSPLTTKVHDMWGGMVSVTAYPAHRLHKWTFGNHKATTMADAIKASGWVGNSSSRIRK